ncbi:MAG: hypothetical protein IT181_11985 [Acidobacteria bacterium]|nr:hypothetical protein [Acidobacteriota bacterium]
MRLVSSLALALLVSAPAVALAQPSTGTVFISGGAFAAIEQFPTSSGFGVPESDSGGTVAGGMLGVGVHLTEKISARVEWSLTDALRQRQDSFAYPYLGAELTSFLPTTSIGRFGEPALSVVPIVPETTLTTAAAFALLGYHVPAGRASIELVGGLGLLNTDVETSYDVRIAAERITVPAAYTSSTYHAVAVVGADVAVRLTDHAAVVPQVRAYALGGGLSVRPGLSLRWTF